MGYVSNWYLELYLIQLFCILNNIYDEQLYHIINKNCKVIFDNSITNTEHHEILFYKSSISVLLYKFSVHIEKNDLS